MSNHTPGPWGFRECGTMNAIVYIDDDCVVGGVHKGGDDYLLSHADARLMAAAPELLEALEAVALHTIGIYDSHGQPLLPDPVSRAVRAVIAKAKGEGNE